MRAVADDPRLTWVWNVYTDPEVTSCQPVPGAAYIPSPRTSFADANFAAACNEQPRPTELRSHGVCYRVVYRPFHPANARRNARRALAEAELRRLA